MTIKVLLADDQALVRAGFRSLLAPGPDIAVVGEAADGDEAVRLARATPPGRGAHGHPHARAATASPPPGASSPTRRSPAAG